MTTFAPYPVLQRDRQPVLALTSLLSAVAFVLLHVPLALAIRQSGTLATVHAAATLLVCAAIAMVAERPVYILAGVGYFAGAEVLWRMSNASVNWEFGKYGVGLVLLIAIFRVPGLRLPRLALLYFALLLPACLIAWFTFGPAYALGQISFDLAGHLA